ncbi:MAG: hypothetical protein H0W31_00095 [Actinobacteria bacterium]|nr:hypothetical protein [Actinomycetota bacterium]
MSDVSCTFCSQTLDESFAYRLISGWERKATAQSRRGGSDVVLRKAHDEFACTACIARFKAGINVHQETLV